MHEKESVGDGISTMQALQNTKGKGNTICKRTIKNSAWSHLYKTQTQDNEAIGWDVKGDCWVKETIGGQSNILIDQINKCKPAENRLGMAKTSNNDKRKRLQNNATHAKEKDKLNKSVRDDDK